MSFDPTEQRRISTHYRTLKRLSDAAKEKSTYLQQERTIRTKKIRRFDLTKHHNFAAGRFLGPIFFFFF